MKIISYLCVIALLSFTQVSCGLKGKLQRPLNDSSTIYYLNSNAASPNITQE